MPKIKINNANIKEWAKNYDGELFDGILCDPPYELGFMGKSWDSSGIAFDVEMWADIYKLLKPGAHLLAFSGSRTYHRMAVAIEDAGFEIRDMIEWVYGSGFPKSLNIGKAVDKIQGNEREAGTSTTDCNYFPEPCKGHGDNNGRYGETIHAIPTKGTSEWEGYGTALKPAHEPCVLARKPLDGTVANNVLKHGTGGLNIDGTRVGTGTGEVKTYKVVDMRGGNYGQDKEAYSDRPKLERTTVDTGRFPANLIHDGSDEVEAVFPQSKGASSQKFNPHSIYGGNSFNRSKTILETDYYPGFNDSGSASRFFYTAKASKSERNAGLDIDEFPLKHYLEANKMGGEKDTMLTGSGNPRDSRKQNHHPTVKPLSLTKYLATLIKPPTGGRLLVPFSGSGSEMIGGLQAGWEYVEGVELTEEYIPIAEARIKYWLEEMKKEQAKPQQVSLI